MEYGGREKIENKNVRVALLPLHFFSLFEQGQVCTNGREGLQPQFLLLLLRTSSTQKDEKFTSKTINNNFLQLTYQSEEAPL
jgi:hypothetical protein